MSKANNTQASKGTSVLELHARYLKFEKRSIAAKKAFAVSKLFADSRHTCSKIEAVTNEITNRLQMRDDGDALIRVRRLKALVKELHGYVKAIRPTFEGQENVAKPTLKLVK